MKYGDCHGIREINGKKFVDIVEILPGSTGKNGKPILWEDLNDGRIDVSVQKFGIRGGNAKPIIMKRFVPVCPFLFEGFGLWLGDGIKLQEGKLRHFGFSNTKIELHKHFLQFSGECFGIFSDQFNAVISVPPRFRNHTKAIVSKISKELEIEKEKFWKTQINPTRNFIHVDIKISSRILALIIDSLFRNLKQIMEADKKLIVAFLKGLIAAEGNVHVRKCGRLGEIMIAIHNKNIRDWVRKLLQTLQIIPNKDKEIPSDEGILIHGFSNFKLVGNFGLCSLHPSKNKSFRKGMSGFKAIQFRKREGCLLILKELSNGLKTSFELAKKIERTEFVARTHLRHLHKIGLIEKEKVIGRKIIWKITPAGRELLSLDNPIQKLRKL